jgi:urease accessory protein
MDEGLGSFFGALQLADPGLPIGRFVHSHGLESWLAERPAAGDDEIEELVASFVLEGVAPLDGAVVALAHRARSLDELLGLDRALTARKTLAPARVASRSCGRQLAALATRLVDDPLVASLATAVGRAQTDGNLAVVSGSLARALGVGEREAVMLELRGAMTSLCSSAIRLGRLGPVSAQLMARRLVPALVAATDESLRTPVGELRSSAFELDIAALVHGRRDSRTFAT